jgi:TrmH family RNA methyltransferase
MAPLSPLILSDALFNQLSSVDSPTGIIAAIKTPKPSAMPRSFDACVMLEDIQDPGNMGSILRSSAAAGIRQIFLSRNSVHAWSPRVLRAGMGAHFMLEIFEATDLSAIIETFDGRVIAMDARAKNAIFDADMTGKIALLFGNEGAGVSRALIDAATQVVAIPMPGKVDSLNVAAAAAVCLFERVRQQYAPTRSVHPAQRVRQS